MDLALANPAGEEAAAVQRKVLPFLKTCGRVVPYSAAAREGCIGEMWALARWFGCASYFWSLAIDDAHSPTCLLLSLRAITADEADNFIPIFQNWSARLYANEVTEEDLAPLDPSGKTSTSRIPLPPEFFQRMVAGNPVAAALTYQQILEIIMEVALGTPPSKRTRRTVPWATRCKGILGRLLASYVVTEVSGRKAQHAHGLSWGGPSPDLLGLLASFTDLLEGFLQPALMSHVTTSLPLGLHVADIARRTLFVPGRRASFAPVPQDGVHPDPQRGVQPSESELCSPCPDGAQLFERGHVAAAGTQMHISHPPSCHQKDLPYCRYCYARGHGPDNPFVVQLIPEGTLQPTDTIIPPSRWLCTQKSCTAAQNVAMAKRNQADKDGEEDTQVSYSVIEVRPNTTQGICAPPTDAPTLTGDFPCLIPKSDPRLLVFEAPRPPLVLTPELTQCQQLVDSVLVPSVKKWKGKLQDMPVDQAIELVREVCALPEVCPSLPLGSSSDMTCYMCASHSLHHRWTSGSTQIRSPASSVVG